MRKEEGILKDKTIQAYLKKQEKNQINNLTLHLKQLEKEEMKNPRVSRRKERRPQKNSTKLKAGSWRR